MGSCVSSPGFVLMLKSNLCVETNISFPVFWAKSATLQRIPLEPWLQASRQILPFTFSLIISATSLGIVVESISTSGIGFLGSGLSKVARIPPPELPWPARIMSITGSSIFKSPSPIAAQDSIPSTTVISGFKLFKTPATLLPSPGVAKTTVPLPKVIGFSISPSLLRGKLFWSISTRTRTFLPSSAIRGQIKGGQIKGGQIKGDRSKGTDQRGQDSLIGFLSQ